MDPTPEGKLIARINLAVLDLGRHSMRVSLAEVEKDVRAVALQQLLIDKGIVTGDEVKLAVFEKMAIILEALVKNAKEASSPRIVVPRASIPPLKGR